VPEREILENGIYRVTERKENNRERYTQRTKERKINGKGVYKGKSGKLCTKERKRGK